MGQGDRSRRRGGNVREAHVTESAPAALDKGPLIDGVPGTQAAYSHRDFSTIAEETDVMRRLETLQYLKFMHPELSAIQEEGR